MAKELFNKNTAKNFIEEIIKFSITLEPPIKLIDYDVIEKYILKIKTARKQ